MKTFRANIVSTLISAGRLNEPSAKNYEKAVFEMTSRLDGGTPSKETYARVAYDKVGQLVNAKDREEREKILADMKRDVDGWDACVYENQLSMYNASMDRSVLKPRAVKGLYKCREKDCGSEEFYVWQEQRRSSDEGATVMRQCFRCGRRGKE